MNPHRVPEWSRPKRILDAALATDAGRTHPGLLHIYLHTMEMSAHPESALPAADLLRGLVPDAGHLQHMPTHIDVLCGDYRSSVQSNLVAVAADRRFVEREGPLNFYSLYRAHDLHFVVYSAMFSGQSADCAAGRRRTRRPVDPRAAVDRITSDGRLAGGVRPVAHSRAGAVRAVGRPDRRATARRSESLYCTTNATLHYGKGVAHAAKGQLAQAKAERDEFAAAYATVPESRYLFNNTSRDILAVAAAMLDGEIAYREGLFRRSVRTPATRDRTR